MKNYVAYYRVSTEEQGKSGLGLDAQKKSVTDYVKKHGELKGHYTDIESGKSDSRKGIKDAIEACKKHGATLVVKEMSRISRGGFKIMVELEEAGIPFIESTAPHDPSMVKAIKFVLAKEEREKLSTRTKDALAEIKRKIKRGEEHISKNGNVVKGLGNPENLTDYARERSAEVRREKALNDSNNVKAGAFIVACRKSGQSFVMITNKLNETGFVTSRGNRFNQVQTKRLFNRYN